MTNPLLCCEGQVCNSGHSASAREAAALHGLPALNAESRDEAERYARRQVSRQLAVTPHVRCGIHRSGYALFACSVCQHERVYGGTLSGCYS